MKKIWVAMVNTWPIWASLDFEEARKAAEKKVGRINWQEHCGPFLSVEEQCRTQWGGLWHGEGPNKEEVFVKLVDFN